MIGIGVGIWQAALQGGAGGLAFSVVSRGADGTSATFRITGTLSCQITDRSADGTSVTGRIT